VTKEDESNTGSVTEEEDRKRKEVTFDENEELMIQRTQLMFENLPQSQLRAWAERMHEGETFFNELSLEVNECILRELGEEEEADEEEAEEEAEEEEAEEEEAEEEEAEEEEAEEEEADEKEVTGSVTVADEELSPVHSDDSPRHANVKKAAIADREQWAIQERAEAREFEQLFFEMKKMPETTVEEVKAKWDCMGNEVDKLQELKMKYAYTDTPGAKALYDKYCDRWSAVLDECHRLSRKEAHLSATLSFVFVISPDVCNATTRLSFSI
jgi:cobalamin biosynthesis protein CobT